MPWKINPDTKAFELDSNGNPVFVLDGGEEKSVDYAAMSQALSKASRESAERKEKIRSLEAVVKQFDGITDIPAFLAQAKKDAEAVASFDDKQKTAEESARARIDAATAPLNAKIKELETANTAALNRYHTALIDAQFGTSSYVAKELVNPAMVKELFSKNFSVDETGRIIATGPDGNTIYDENGPAGFESALRKLVTGSPYKDFVLKGSTARGSGASAGGGRNSNGGKPVMSRGDFEKLDPLGKSDFFKKGGTIQD